MNMNKMTTIFGVVAVVIAVFFIIAGIRTYKKMAQDQRITIGILQTASHPALDAALKGFTERLKKQWGNKVAFVLQNAQGSVANAQTIAQSFHARSDINAIFAIATPAAKAAASVEKNKPIFIAAVTDPQALGLLLPDGNVTGSTDMINIDDLIDAAVKLVPNIKTVGIVYTVAEPNSVLLVDTMVQRLQQNGIVPMKFGATSEADIARAIENAVRKTDLILTPTDNTVASTITLLAQKALQGKKPLIVSDNLLVQYGPLAARGVDYTMTGIQAAESAIAVLEGGKKPNEVLVAQPGRSKIFVNKKTLEALGLSIPTTLESKIEFIK